MAGRDASSAALGRRGLPVRPAARSWPPIRSDAGADPRPGDRVLTWDGAELVVVRAGAVVDVDRWGDAAEEPTREVLSLAEWAWAWRDGYRRARAGEGGGPCSRAG